MIYHNKNFIDYSLKTHIKFVPTRLLEKVADVDTESLEKASGLHLPVMSLKRMVKHSL